MATKERCTVFVTIPMEAAISMVSEQFPNYRHETLDNHNSIKILHHATQAIENAEIRNLYLVKHTDCIFKNTRQIFQLIGNDMALTEFALKFPGSSRLIDFSKRTFMSEDASL